MARASFSDVSKGGMGFQGGRVHVDRSFSTMFQYQPNSTTGEQSAAFPALVWKAHRLDENGAAKEDQEGNKEEVEIVHRMGGADDNGNYSVRPGKLNPRDFDNTDVEPDEVDDEPGSEGNSFILDAGAKFGAGWGHMEESLKKLSFKSDVLGRCVTTDFEGMDATFKMQEGAPYIAKKGKNKGQEVKPTNLVCERVNVFPYDKPKAGTGAKTTTATKAGTKAPVKAEAVAATGGDEAFEAACVIFGGGTHPKVNGGAEVSGMTPAFSKAVPADKEVKLDDFYKAAVGELMRRKVVPTLHKPIMDGVLKNGDRLTELAAWLMENEKPSFTADEKTIQFVSA